MGEAKELETAQNIPRTEAEDIAETSAEEEDEEEEDDETVVKGMTTPQEPVRARVYFKRTVRRVKRNFWCEVLENIKEPDDVYRVTRWLKPRQRISPAPIQVDGQVYSTNKEKARALGQAKLTRRTADDDIADPWLYPVVSAAEIPFDDRITLEETRFGLLSTGNTSPGTDGVTTDILRGLWPTIGQLVTDIYCPSTLRKAEVVMIPKPNKRNLTDPSAWRPISLLSCLSNGLERIIAKRMSNLAIKHDILHHNQAGALPQLNAIAEAVELLLGIPQGSPLSPILYLLAAASLYQLEGATHRYGYADDTATLFEGDTLEETTAQANAAIAAMEKWGRAEGFAFDVQTTEVMHFTRRRYTVTHTI
ncbi:hypothetical protein NLG97_g3120 [Lecanicillium saksenae]|uniref:Uncharacterized protein n=1 Tax=Lecanicillium saksenae TaxID=468837 RepID=A0ACC1QZ17_9HYPO|nr:hypothetical protein NLG97_g3120 [Lecanicillium saksenae]